MKESESVKNNGSKNGIVCEIGILDTNEMYYFNFEKNASAERALGAGPGGVGSEALRNTINEFRVCEYFVQLGITYEGNAHVLIQTI